MNTTYAFKGVACAVIALTIMVAGCEQSPAPETATTAADATDVAVPATTTPPPELVRVKIDQARSDDYHQVRTRAIAWLDALDVDVPELDRHGINGIKKLSEILWAYRILHDHTEDAGERARFVERARSFAARTADLDYHTLDACSPEEFDEKILAYLLAARLIHEFGFDSRTFRHMIQLVESRVRQNMLRRGSRQRDAAADLYRALDLDVPEILLISPPNSRGVLARRAPPETVTLAGGYELSHEVYVAFDYGDRRNQDRLTDEDIAYLYQVIPSLIDECIRQQYADLLAELLSNMIYLGWQSDPAAERALNFLLDTQNDNGTWGNYEVLRAQYGPYVDQQMYLHTVQVTIRALCEAYDGGWPPRPAPAPAD